MYMGRSLVLVSATSAVVLALFISERRRRRRVSPSAPPSSLPSSPPSTPKASASEAATSLDPKTGYRQLVHTLREQNKSVVRDWEAREWAKAKAKVQERVARAERMEAEGIPDPVREKSKALLAARKAREEAAAAHGCDEPAKEPAGHACRRKEASAGRAGGALPAKAAPLAQPNLMRPAAPTR